ncbi:hypothetical protein EVAR_10516_1 [Eumeta japonica]|uniref:Uncharacterized protein n=1 Tax=Eumeta variegata TaxID=151549 RepID=A0A4C1TIE3_EUMVA|nr:hypothetical protein EVAR_10516_1 [Eumeta japonica]
MDLVIDKNPKSDITLEQNILRLDTYIAASAAREPCVTMRPIGRQLRPCLVLVPLLLFRSCLESPTLHVPDPTGGLTRAARVANDTFESKAVARSTGSVQSAGVRPHMKRKGFNMLSKLLKEQHYGSTPTTRAVDKCSTKLLHLLHEQSECKNRVASALGVELLLAMCVEGVTAGTEAELSMASPPNAKPEQVCRLNSVRDDGGPATVMTYRDDLAPVADLRIA